MGTDSDHLIWVCQMKKVHIFFIIQFGSSEITQHTFVDEIIIAEIGEIYTDVVG